MGWECPPSRRSAPPPPPSYPAPPAPCPTWLPLGPPPPRNAPPPPGAAKRPGSQPLPNAASSTEPGENQESKQRSRLNLLVLNRTVTASHLRAWWRNQRKPARQKRRTEGEKTSSTDSVYEPIMNQHAVFPNMRKATGFWKMVEKFDASLKSVQLFTGRSSQFFGFGFGLSELEVPLQRCTITTKHNPGLFTTGTTSGTGPRLLPPTYRVGSWMHRCGRGPVQPVQVVPERFQDPRLLRALVLEFWQDSTTKVRSNLGSWIREVHNRSNTTCIGSSPLYRAGLRDPRVQKRVRSTFGTTCTGRTSLYRGQSLSLGSLGGVRPTTKCPSPQHPKR